MADAKTTDLVALTTAVDADILPIVDDVGGGSVETKKITVANLLTGRNIVGGTLTGVFDAGAATSFEIPNSATPTVDAAGEIAIDTSITDHTGAIVYHDGTEVLVAIAMPLANLLTTDGYVVSYDAAANEFVMVANGSALPVADGTAVVKGSADATKLVRIEADGLTTGTTRVITMPDADVDLGALAITTGDVYTGVHDFGGAGSLEIPNSATPTVDAAGEIAVDTSVADHTGMIKYHDGTEELTVIALPTANLISTDAYVITYNAANNEFEMTTKSGSGMADLVDDVTPQLGAALDVNAFAIVSASAGDIALTPDTTGDVILDGLKWPQADGTANQVIETDGAGQLAFVAAGGGSGAPFVDSTAIIKGSADATKLVRIEADGITTATTRVITMPDADVDLRKNNYTATVAPGATDDSTAGYAAGSIWIDTIASNSYICQDPIATTAIWAQTDGAGGGSDTWGADQDSAGFDINDANGNLLIEFETIASANTHVYVRNSSGGNGPILAAKGTAADISLAVQAKGNGASGEAVVVQPRLECFDSSLCPPLNITPRSSAPTSPKTNDIYLDDGTNTTSFSLGFRQWSGAAWQDITG